MIRKVSLRKDKMINSIFLEKKQELELMEKQEYKKILIKLDPYLEIEKRGIFFLFFNVY